MFRTKVFHDIIASMLGQMRATQNTITDFNVGGVARVMLEAPAAEIDQLYQMMAQGLIEGIPTAIYRSFDFDLLPARHANGVVRIFARPDHSAVVTIPVGFMVASVNGQRYQTAEQGVIPVGQEWVEVLASAIEPGPVGNVQAGTITRPISSGLGIVGVTNPQAFSEGRGAETPAERKLRFIEFVRTLARGTPASLQYIAKQAAILDPRTGVAVERVARATPEETTGHYNLYIYNGAGGTSDALVARCQQLVDGYNDPETGIPVSGYAPAGMRVDVHAMRELLIDATLEAQVPFAHRTEALRAQVLQVLRETIRGVPSGGRLRPLDLVNAAVSLDAVGGANIQSPLLTTPCPIDAVLLPGTLAVLWI